MKITASIAVLAAAVGGSTAFTLLTNNGRQSAVKPLHYGWNQIPGQSGNAPPSGGGQQAFPAPAAGNPFAPAFPGAAPPAAAPAPIAPAAPPAAAPAGFPGTGYGPAAPAPAAQAPPAAAPPAPAPVDDEQMDDEPMSKAWAARVDYDRSQDVFPEFPPGYRSFDEIWAEFQAKKASGAI